MNTSNTTILATGLSGESIQQLAQLSRDKGPLIGSTTHLIGSSEGFIGNRLPSTQN